MKGFGIHSARIHARILTSMPLQRWEESFCVLKEAGAIEAGRAEPRVDDPDERAVTFLTNVDGEQTAVDRSVFIDLTLPVCEERAAHGGPNLSTDTVAEIA